MTGKPYRILGVLSAAVFLMWITSAFAADLLVPSHYPHIQDAVNAADPDDVIIVDAGTYDEALNIENKLDLTIKGVDRDTVILKPPTTFDWNVGGYGSGRQAAVRVVDSANITLEKMTMDFSLVADNDVAGVLYWNSSGIVEDNVLKNMSVPDASGGYREYTSWFEAPKGVLDYAYQQVSILSNQFVDTGRLGVCTQHYVSATIQGNTFTQTTGDFGYAVEMGSESAGIIEGNTIQGYDTTSVPESLDAVGIYVHNAYTGGTSGVGKSVAVTDNEVFDCQWALHIGNEFDNYAGDVDIFASVVGNRFHDNADGAVRIFDEDKEHGSSIDAWFQHNTIKYNGAYGYLVDTQGDGCIVAAMSGETVTGHAIGLRVADNGPGPSSSTYDISIHGSWISGNSGYGVYSDVASTVVDATGNWWGDINGPGGHTPADPVRDAVTFVPADGGGDHVSEDVRIHFDPWETTPIGAPVCYIDVNKNEVYDDGIDVLYLLIQDAVNFAVADDWIIVFAGTHEEALNIENMHGLTLKGEDKTTVVLKPPTTFDWNVGGYGSGRQAAVRVVEGTDVTLAKMTMDFSLVAGNDVAGLLYWNSSGTVEDNVLKNMSVPDASGGYREYTSWFEAPKGVLDYAYQQVSILSNQFVDTGRLGVCTQHYVSATIQGNTFTQTTDDFGYAIEMGSESAGIIEGNTIQGYDTPSVPESLDAVGIYVHNAYTGGTAGVGKSVAVTDNEVFDCQWALHIGNEFDNYAGDVDIFASVADNRFHDNADGAVRIFDEDKEHGSSVDAWFYHNTILYNGDYGYLVDTQGDGCIVAAMSGETVTGHAIGLRVADNAPGPSNSAYDISIHDSRIEGNSNYGIYSDVASTVVDATENWWGDLTGPGGHTPADPVRDAVTLVPADGGGDHVSEDVRIHFDPWETTPYIEGCTEGDLCVRLYLHGCWNGSCHRKDSTLDVELYDPSMNLVDSFIDVYFDIYGLAVVDVEEAGLSPGDYYVLVRHFNHLDLISEDPIPFDMGLTNWADYSDPDNVECGESTLYDDNGTWTMPVDINGDQLVSLADYLILYVNWTLQNPQCDVDCDGYCRLGDYLCLYQDWTKRGCAP